MQKKFLPDTISQWNRSSITGYVVLKIIVIGLENYKKSQSILPPIAEWQ